jgi:hypothetical protein
VALRDECGYWSKFDSQATIDTPEIGTAGGVNLGTFEAGKFGNAFLSDLGAAPYEYVYFPTAFMTGTKGAIEFYMKAKNSIPPNPGTNRALFYCRTATQYLLAVITTAGDVSFQIDGSSAVINITNAITYSANDLIHWLFIWDSDAGFDGSKTMAIYKDKVEQANSTTDFGTITYATNIYFGIGVSGAGAPNGSPCTELLDNVKVYKDITPGIKNAIFANSNNEGVDEPVKTIIS